MNLMILTLVLTVNALAISDRNVVTVESLATAEYHGQRQHQWPFPLLSIGHAMHSYQDYGGSPYWHDGLDIRSNPNEPIFAAVGGKVVNIENYQPGHDAYWEVAILDDEGYVWKYHHVEKSSIPQEVKDAYKNKTVIKTGAFIGNVIPWSWSAFGERYHHLHLLVVGKDGKYINPFLMMAPLADTLVPEIKAIGLAKNHRPISGTEVRGPHALYVEAYDLTLHQKFLLPPYKISYSLDGAPVKTVWEFIHLPGGESDTKYINDFHFSGTCGDYDCRKFYFNLNFTREAPRGQWTLSPGSHSIEVTVEDISGNKSSKSFSWTVL